MEKHTPFFSGALEYSSPSREPTFRGLNIESFMRVFHCCQSSSYFFVDSNLCIKMYIYIYYIYILYIYYIYIIYIFMSTLEVNHHWKNSGSFWMIINPYYRKKGETCKPTYKKWWPRTSRVNIMSKPNFLNFGCIQKIPRCSMWLVYSPTWRA